MDALGDRMKCNYENRTRYYLPRRVYTIIRVDGKAFHTYTRGMKKPYDQKLNECMDMAAKSLLGEVQGGLFVYTQSDEISVVSQDFVEQDTQAWFDGNLQKICSISASVVTAQFNFYHDSGKFAYFDSRVFTISDPAEVANYFVWRTRDAIRNSINMLGQNYFSPKDMHGKNTTQVKDMLILEKYANWNKEPDRFKTGSLQKKSGSVTIPTSNLYQFYSDLLKGV
jgi:tRNA(His) guanylyltransferase